MEMEVLPEGVSAPIKKGPGLYEFLMEAELAHYFNSFKNNLKVTHPSQLKFATDEDLIDLGMSKPELRRMRKYYDKHFANNYLTKFKKLLTQRKQQLMSDGFGSNYSVSGAPGEYMMSRGSGDGSSSAVSTKPRVPNKHIISPANITVNKELGMGEFGVVQQGVWCNEGERIQVAIKCLVRERMQTNTIEFLKEAVIMHSIDHPHIVRLFGVVLDMGSLMLVTELAPLRSLLECLKEPSVRASFPVMTLADFAVQICDGMQYLEAKRFIHRDLAARNILVFSKNKVKISDFGLSRALGQGKDYYQTNFNVNLKLPIAWCAPECISYLRFTTSSDVWAYGVTLWEMFSYGFQPWAALTGQQILEAIDDPHFQRLEQPDCCPHEYYALMLDCWRHEPAQRPRFSEIAGQRLPDCRPEQVQAKMTLVAGGGGAAAAAASSETMAQMIGYRVGDVVTVLDKLSHRPLWKGISPAGKSGLFDPTNFISYLGPDLPSLQSSSGGVVAVGSHHHHHNHHHNHHHYQSNSAGVATSAAPSTGGMMGGLLSGGGSLLRSSIRRSKLRSEMISGPQGDVKHMGHVGLDGAHFGDLSFLNGDTSGGGGGGASCKSEYGIPTQIVPPYRPTSSSITAITDYSHQHHHHHHHLAPDSMPLLDQQSAAAVSGTNDQQQHFLHQTDGGGAFDHEYHEISDEESSDGGGTGIIRGANGSNGNGSPDLDLGPSLMAEMELMFSSLGGPPPPPSPAADHTDGSNKANELREKLNASSERGGTLTKANVKTHKLAATVKPISAQDSKTLDTAIAIANELSTTRPKSSSHHHHHHNHHYSTTNQQQQQQQQHHHHQHSAYSPHIAGVQAPVTPTSPPGCGSGTTNNSATAATGKRKFSFRFPSAASSSSGGGGAGSGQGGGGTTADSVELRNRNFAEELQSTPHLQSKVTQEAQLAYQGLVGPSTDLSQFGSSNPLRLLRSGNLPLIKPRLRTTTLPNSHFWSQELKLPNENVNKSTDTLRASLSSDTSHTDEAICRPFGQSEENPIPLPPRDRNKPLLLSKPRHTRKHPLIIPPSSLQTTLHKYVAHKQDDMAVSPTEPLYSNLEQQQPLNTIQPSSSLSSNVSQSIDSLHFEARIDSELAALDHVPDLTTPANEAATIDLTTTTQLDAVAVADEVRLRRHHVSCEDLLEFADRRPSSRERGEESDEVRIMCKVLGNDYSASQCVETLEYTDWDVIRAIKLCRLRKLVSGAEISACNVALDTTGWDVTKAAQFILQHDAEVQL